MEYNQRVSFQRAADLFEEGNFNQGANYLLKAYYEEGKSQEILGYFDEIFFKPNIEELERIYNLNIEKINLEQEYNQFKDLPYYIIPIEEGIFYVYDKESNDIISENFTSDQKATIILCTDENLSVTDFLNEYEDEIKTKELISKMKKQIKELKSMSI